MAFAGIEHAALVKTLRVEQSGLMSYAVYRVSDFC